jgi:hypothetical protein
MPEKRGYETKNYNQNMISAEGNIFKTASNWEL